MPIRYGCLLRRPRLPLTDRGHPMQIGYARSSTIDQEAGYPAQIKTLTAAGCDKIFAEKVSSVAQRARLRPRR
jgi:hypothetical protein